MFTTDQIQLAENFGQRVIRTTREAWLRFCFATGHWKGFMVHANHRGHLGKSYYIKGLDIGDGSNKNFAGYKVTRDGTTILSLSSPNSGLKE